MNQTIPKVIFLFSGKRKTGKDYVTDVLNNKLSSNGSIIIRLSGPLKYEYAKINQLDSDKLYSASSYKEKYREDMVKWSEEIRAKDDSYFLKAALKMYNAFEYPIWIVSDMRRLSDLAWFKKEYNHIIITVRITASEETRFKRGFVFTPNIDDAETECNLDFYNEWDYIFPNEDGIDEKLNEFIDLLCKRALA
ncbi:UNVERIFIED_CONTAM: hypothetical protein RMT77_002476 [Armadillidium vulgare]|nr:Phosphomevalonate kinase [Armadillidium vulgare]